jgi:dipeptidyl aminopeptidase/acylaminoacyl peptidase
MRVWEKLIRMRLFAAWICSIVLVLCSGAALAQQQTKRPITQNDLDSWRTIRGQQISRDGKFVGYTFASEKGDSELVVRNVASGVEWRVPRGASPKFTADSRFAVFSIEPAKDAIKKAKSEKPPGELPQNALGIMDLTNGEVTRIERVKDFQVPEDGAGFVAYRLETKPGDKEQEPKKEQPKVQTSTTVSAATASPRPPLSPTATGAPTPSPIDNKVPKREFGSDLILRNTATNNERVYHDAVNYSFSKDDRSLVYAVSSKKEETNGIYVVTPQNESSSPVALLTGDGKYERLTWDEDETQLAFISDRDDAKAAQPKFKIYIWNRREDRGKELVSNSSPGFRKDFVVSDKASLSFSLDGSRLFFGATPAPQPKTDPDKAPVDDDEKVVVDLWHWNDDYIQPVQKIRAEQDRNRSYLAVSHIKDKRVVQLADESMEEVLPSGKGRYAIGSDDRSYRRMSDWDQAGYRDYYLVDTGDGSRKILLRKQQFGLSLSPNEKYATYFDGKDWHSLSIPDGKDVNLTKNLAANFWYEDNDTTAIPGPYWTAGWSKDDEYVLLYDRYDVWQVKPAGDGAVNLTRGLGRKQKTALRYVQLDPKEQWIDLTKPLLLRAENEETRDTGFYRVGLDGGLPKRLLMAAKSYDYSPAKAKDADVFMFTASRFDEFPDLLVSDLDFKNIKKVSNGDAQRAQFIWGTSELVSFKNGDGVPLKGILFKPENFDPAKKYPMIVYIYEKLSQDLHRFVNPDLIYPDPGVSVNPTYYASNGYLVFMPDIVYTIGYPGQSALKCVLPAVQAVVDKGFVDENAIGIEGHSWGAYQIAYMVTQTNRFKAAAASAAVSNMTSAYGGIRWYTGLPRQYIYEQGQSRIGGTLWEYPMRFIENSPVFRADRVQTPLMMQHNDQDGAVPWYQGIEYYLALRRLGKEVYLFNYNGEGHGLQKPQNQKDYTRRLQEFFDHFLKGTPAPEWMEKGIPYLQREKEKEQYKINSGKTNK